MNTQRSDIFIFKWVQSRVGAIPRLPTRHCAIGSTYNSSTNQNAKT